MLIVCTGFVQKWENRIPGLFQGFFPFSRTQFLPNFVLNNAKNALFSAENIEVKRLVFFDRDSGDKNGTIAQIE